MAAEPTNFVDHVIKVVNLDTDSWINDGAKIAKLADEMQEKGYTLTNVFSPNSETALVVFTKPRKP